MRLIDADAFDKALSDAQAECKRNGGNFRFGVLANVRGNLSKAPSVDAAPVVHGRWIPVLNGIDDDTNPAFDCSECDAMCSKKHNYCPVCGAKMDSEEQDADRE